jgi:hypothetical protein
MVQAVAMNATAMRDHLAGTLREGKNGGSAMEMFFRNPQLICELLNCIHGDFIVKQQGYTHEEIAGDDAEIDFNQVTERLHIAAQGVFAALWNSKKDAIKPLGQRRDVTNLGSVHMLINMAACHILRYDVCEPRTFTVETKDGTTGKITFSPVCEVAKALRLNDQVAARQLWCAEDSLFTESKSDEAFLEENFLRRLCCGGIFVKTKTGRGKYRSAAPDERNRYLVAIDKKLVGKPKFSAMFLPDGVLYETLTTALFPRGLDCKGKFSQSRFGAFQVRLRDMMEPYADMDPNGEGRPYVDLFAEMLRKIANDKGNSMPRGAAEILHLHAYAIDERSPITPQQISY